MSEGLRVLSSVCSSQSVSAFSRLRSEWFITDQEINTYRAIQNHYRRFGTIPSLRTLFNLGVDVVPDSHITEVFDFYLSRVVDRYGYGSLVDFHARLGELLSRRNITDATNLLRDQLSTLTNTGISQDVVGIQQLGSDLLSELRNMRSIPGTGVITGYQEIDEEIESFEAGDMLLLAGRPKLGKTFYVLDILINNWINGKSVLVVSMEMSPKQLVKRLLSMIARVNPNMLRGRNISDLTLYRMQDTLRGFDDYPPLNFVAGNFRKTPDDIDRYMRLYRPDLCVTDGAYLLTPDDRNKGNAKHEVLANIIQSLKGATEDNQTILIPTVQFNRGAGGTNRNNNRRVSSDLDIEYLAGTDAFGQVPSYIIGLSRVPGRDDMRRMKALAAREAPADADMLLNFQFSPPDFSYIRHYDEDAINAGTLDSIDEETREALL